jgi:hypothetical protein
MTDSLNKMFALLDSAIRSAPADVARTSADLLPAVDFGAMREVFAHQNGMHADGSTWSRSYNDADLLEVARDNRARAWLASLPAAQR